jgi:beta-galactosidase
MIILSSLLKAKPLNAEIAILYNPEIQIFAWASTGNEKTATNSLLGYHTALYKHNYIIDFVHPAEVIKGILSNYKVLIVPFPYTLNKEVCAEIEEWVKKGGVIIGEANFAGWNMEGGHHEKIIPGYGLHKMFKAREGLVEPPNKNRVTRLGITKDFVYKRRGTQTKDHVVTEYLNVLNDKISVDEHGVRIIIKKDIDLLRPFEEIRGSIIKETLITEGAEVIAEFDTGEPAVTVADYGKGKAVLIGSYIGLPVLSPGHESNLDFIASLVNYTSDVKRINTDKRKVRVDILKDAAKDVMLIVQNLTSEFVESCVNIPYEKQTSLKEIFNGDMLKLNPDKEGGSFITVRLEPKEVRVYRD